MSRIEAQSKSSREFYRNLVPLDNFDAATNSKAHVDLPNDWWIVVADIQGSTSAIEAGRYKDVNTVGAATIMAVLNANKAVDVPFIFGGDGATLAVPPESELAVRRALLGAKDMASAGFQLDLRVGMVPVMDAVRGDRHVRIAKYKLSDAISQAAISGFGWSWAESVLKNPETRSKYEVIPGADVTPEADFTGFQCRWKPIESSRDFKLAIIVQAMESDPAAHAETYAEVMGEVTRVFGGVEQIHPVTGSGLSLSLRFSRLAGEIKVYGPRLSVWSKTVAFIKMAVISVVGNLLMRGIVKSGDVDWGNYRDDVVKNTDFRKFDGALKMVVDGTVAQEKALRAFLESGRERRKLVYGTHRSEHAIMTCLVFAPGQKHAHFVDGSDGGYAVAAKELKAQLSVFKDKNKK